MKTTTTTATTMRFLNASHSLLCVCDSVNCFGLAICFISNCCCGINERETDYYISRGGLLVARGRQTMSQNIPFMHSFHHHFHFMFVFNLCLNKCKFFFLIHSGIRCMSSAFFFVNIWVDTFTSYPQHLVSFIQLC